MNDYEQILKRLEKVEKENAEIRATLDSIMKPMNNIKSAAEIISMIPKDVLNGLGVTAAIPDPNMVWFKLVCSTGFHISVKKQDFDFRIRVRDSHDKLIKETNASMNGLVAALKSLIWKH